MMETIHDPNQPQRPPTLEYLSAHRPTETYSWRNGDSVIGPADAAGRLEVEAGILGREAAQHDPDSHMGQRLDMAIKVRETAITLLDQHGGDERATLRALRQARRKAIQAGDTAQVANIDRERIVIRAVGRENYQDFRSDGGVSETLRRFTQANRDPQFAERGLLAQLGLAVKSYVSYTPGQTGFGVAKRAAFHTPRTARAISAFQRRQAIREIDERHAAVTSKRVA